MAELPVDEKASHQEVEYQYPSERMGRACGNCEHVIESRKGTRCETVASPIYLNGWCKRWEKDMKQ